MGRLNGKRIFITGAAAKTAALALPLTIVGVIDAFYPETGRQHRAGVPI